METFYEVMRRKGISRRSFMKYCSLTATSLGLALSFMLQIAHAMEDKPCLPVQGLHGLVWTCCTEPFIQSAHPLTKDVILSMISWDYNNTLMAAAGLRLACDVLQLDGQTIRNTGEVVDMPEVAMAAFDPCVPFEWRHPVPAGEIPHA